MALTEIALLSLALNLSTAPTTIDIQRYNSLDDSDKIRIENLIQDQDALPAAIENMQSQMNRNPVAASPTKETWTR